MISYFLNPLTDTMRWGLWAPVAITTGVMVYFSLPNEPPFSVAYVITAVAAFLFLLALFGFRQRPFFYILCLGLMWVLLGFAAGIFRTSLVAHPVLKQSIDYPVMAHGTVELVEDVHSGTRILLSNVNLWKIPPEETPERIRIVTRSREMPSIVPGDRIAVRVSLSPPPRPVLPHGYDFARMVYFSDMAGAVGFATSTPYIVRAHDEEESIMRRFNRALERHRYHITERIYHALEKDYSPSITGITAAMITSEVGRISLTDLTSLRASGLAHILSISGLHMVLAGSILFVGVRMLLALFPFIALHYPIKKWAAAAAIIASFYYLLIAGMPVPAERSYLMLTLFFVAVILDRTNTPMRPIALAAGFLILLKPESILDPSFQMSFAAVIALCAYFGEPQEKSLHNNLLVKSGKHLWAVAMASVIAGGATAPFAFHHFGQYAVYGLFANMLVVPLTSFVIMPAGVVALLMMPFGLEHWPLAAMAEGIRGMMWVSNKITALPFSTLNLPHMRIVPLILMVFGGLWICLWVRQVRWLGLIPIMIGIILYSAQKLPNVVVDERGKLFAVRDPDIGMLVPTRTYARYARQYWSKALGIGEMVRFDELPASHPLATCTETACRWKIQGVRFFRGEKCADTDVLILTRPETCQGHLYTITPQDLAQNGTYALWVRHGKLHIESVEKPRGHRGWTMH